MMLKQTKIVASISDLRCEVDFIRDLFNAGMNVVRMNTAHASREGFEKLINNVRTVSNRIGILMDTKGPEVRTTASAEGPIDFKTGEKVRIVGNPEQETTHECIAVTYPGFVHDLSVGADVLMDDGELALKVIDKNEDTLFCEVRNDATLGSRKSVNVPGVRINLPSLTEKDRNNILYAIEKDIDFIAHSFVRNRQDVLDIREILDAHHSDIKIIAKICAECRCVYSHVHSLAGCHPCSYVSSRGGTYFQCSSAGGVSSQINDFLCMRRSNLRIRTEFLSPGSRIHFIRQQQIIVYLL
jgi:pyruvate kinase